MKILLPTSTAGSLPKPSWLAQPEILWSPWKLEGEELIGGKQDALRLAVEDQRQAGQAQHQYEGRADQAGPFVYRRPGADGALLHV